MSAIATDLLTVSKSRIASVQEHTENVIDELLNSLIPVEQLSADERRGIIARYTAVLEGNFIYWMTGAWLAVSSPDASAIIVDNLREEVRDCHPAMLRRFAMAADAFPTDADVMSVHGDVLNVRLFIGRLEPAPILAMMAFFEGFIQRFMAYLASLAELQGSKELEYTDVHGVCDIAHTQGLYQAFSEELALANGNGAHADVLEGVELLGTVMRKVIEGHEELFRCKNLVAELTSTGRVECQQ